MWIRSWCCAWSSRWRPPWGRGISRRGWRGRRRWRGRRILGRKWSRLTVWRKLAIAATVPTLDLPEMVRRTQAAPRLAGPPGRRLPRGPRSPGCGCASSPRESSAAPRSAPNGPPSSRPSSSPSSPPSAPRPSSPPPPPSPPPSSSASSPPSPRRTSAAARRSSSRCPTRAPATRFSRGSFWRRCGGARTTGTRRWCRWGCFGGWWS
mmetsp:Transcript_5256/g.12627  ORF Transcript_5256/g.12627 Transcript_5256/m.12627 type:complete len:207 (+) Transcript_5256:83-703(+)